MKTLILILLPFLLIAQPPTNRYNEDLFEVTKTDDILFSTNVPQPNFGGGFYEWITGYPLNADESDLSNINLYMDIYEPTGDTLSKRPLVIVCFGGGFLSGSKDHWSIVLLCEQLAKRGYVAAAIDYRLGMNIFDSDLANRAVYRGLQDGRSAVRFFRADADGANNYKVDPDHIFIGGHSSGAFIGLHNAYLDKEEERPISTYEWMQDGNTIPDQGCIECVGDNTSYDGHANGVFSLAGALGFTSFIESEDDPKVVMFHSTDDETVPYDSGEPFSGVLWAVIGDDLPTVYGSLPISTEASSQGLPYSFHSYSSRGHGVHENDPSLYTDIIPGISDWFFSEELKPLYDGIIGDSILCNSNLTHTYSLPEGDGIYFAWEINGGTYDIDNHTNEMEVTFNPLESDHSISVTAYSELDAKGDLLELDIDLQANNSNIFLHQSADWNDPSNWSMGYIPVACDDVVINSHSVVHDISILQDIELNSLFIGAGISLTNDYKMELKQKTNFNTINPMILKGTLINNQIINFTRTEEGLPAIIENDGLLINKNSINIYK